MKYDQLIEIVERRELHGDPQRPNEPLDASQRVRHENGQKTTLLPENVKTSTQVLYRFLRAQ